MFRKKLVQNKWMQEMNQWMTYNLKEREHCLRMVGQRLMREDDTRLQRFVGRNIIESTILKQCLQCAKRNTCKFTVGNRDELGRILEENGQITVEDLRSVCECIHVENWVNESNSMYRQEVILQQMEQQLKESRSLIGQQYVEAGEMLHYFMKKQENPIQEDEKRRKLIEKGLSAQKIKVGSVYTYYDRMKGNLLYLFVRKKSRKEMTRKELGRILSGILGMRVEPIAKGNQRVKDLELLGFQKVAKFHVLTGVISCPYQENMENGDSFSLMPIGSKRFISMISDGMGTGKLANRDSKRVVEILEDLLAAGLDEVNAIGVLQSIFMLHGRGERYTTLDYFQLNLDAGIGSFFKFGACPTFVKRKDKIERIDIQGLPIEVLQRDQLPVVRKKLEAEDLIIQISDGVLDGFGEDGIEIIEDYMRQIKSTRPQGFLEELKGLIEDDADFKKNDDMTMIALGIMDKY